MAPGGLGAFGAIGQIYVSLYAFEHADEEKTWSMRFVVFTHVIHKEENGIFYAYSPYVREMNLWLKFMDAVEILAPREEGKKIKSEAPYHHPRLNFTSLPGFHFLNFTAALRAVVVMPWILLRMFGAMRRADHIHIRCPGNIGLLGVIIQIFFPWKSKTVKYAGNWDPNAEQPWTYKLQRWILNNTLLSRKIKVLVYGEWPGQSKNIVPFFTASFSEKEKEPVQKRREPPFQFIYAGNLVPGKGIKEAIRLVQKVNQYKAVRLNIYGDGILEQDLQKFIGKEGLEEVVKLWGRVDLQTLKLAYRNAHIVILPSQSEGWPKLLAEGMFFGCIPVATKVSCVPWICGNGSRGVLLSKKKVHEQKRVNIVEGAEKLQALTDDPEEMERMGQEAMDWSRDFTMEKFELAIKNLLDFRKKADTI